MCTVYVYKQGFQQILIFHFYLQRQKGGDLTQPYDKSPYTNRNVKRANFKVQNCTILDSYIA